jgi:molybdopterin-guanine dinucleotide biosynthesis protein A
MERIEGMDGVILAGGRSRRMGTDKAALPWENATLVERQAARLAKVFGQVVVSAREPGRFAAVGLPVIADGERPEAPIAGIAACLRALGRPVFVLAVDLPFVPISLIAGLSRELLDGSAPAVAPRASGKIQCLCAGYRPAILPLAERRIARGLLSVHGLLEEAGGQVWDEARWRALAPPTAFDNINTPQDYETFRSR